MRIAGIDQGTTSTRALVVNRDGKLEVVHSVAHQQSYPQTGWVEHDPEELMRNIQACVDAAGKLEAIGIDNQGESCLAWDAQTKKALSPVIVWQDNRTLADLDTLRAQGLEAQTVARAGLPLTPYFSASKLGWIVRNLPAAQEALKRGTLRLGTTDAFFLDRLTGQFVTDVTTASRTSLMKLDGLCWDQTLCDIFGVPIECLPRIVPTTGDFGCMKTASGPVPVTASVVDQQAALYGFGCRRKGQAKVTFGTGAFALMVTEDEIVNRPELGLLPTVAWQLDGQEPVYAVDGGVFTASAALNWARSLGLFSSYHDINAFAALPAIESGLVFVPALAGLGCPHWEPRARGVWLGLSLEHTKDQMVQSVLEGVALRAAEVVQAMDRCIPLADEVLIDGGMSKNPYFTQFLANVTGKVIRSARMPELTGLGTILLAGDHAGCKFEAVSDFHTCTPHASKDRYQQIFSAAVTISRNW
uniref:FGGY family carbohydrate kinase n=1 Tax=Pararhizobium sp. IMCC3301 TaxID=3067904 RepID=UPI0027419E35|nr:FGGY family carbohydrate kinase [Pararhizobium sp. IMCC3301]